MASTMSDVQKIAVTLSEPDLAIEPGTVAHLVVTMTNRQETPDRLSLEIEGLDMEWYMIPVPAVNVAAGGQAGERILFKVARGSENRAGSYPFLVRVQAMETGAVGIAQATLVVKPFNALQVEMNPKRAVASFFRPMNEFEVNVGNLGNTEETLNLYASDPEDGCAYEFDTDRITLKPGQSQTVPLLVRPKVSSLLGGQRLYGFTVSARSVEDSYISANTHGQVEKHALVSPLLGIFVLLLAFAGAGWLLMRPRPPVPVGIHFFNAERTHVTAGQDVKLSWDVSPNYRQIILYHQVGHKGALIADGEQHSAAGSIHVQPDPPQTTYTLVVRGDGNQRKASDPIAIDVTPAPAPPKPVLKTFSADPPVIHLGESTVLNWEGKAKFYVLDPGGLRLESFERSHQVTPDRVGDAVYTLRAFNDSDNPNPPTKKVTIHVADKDESIASVPRFEARPASPYIGDPVQLRWRTAYALRGVRIDPDHGGTIGSVPASGSVSFVVNDPTTFTLTATDSAGLPVTKKLAVTPKPKPPPPPLTNPPTGENTTPTPGGNAPSTTPPPAGGTPPGVKP